MTTAVRFTPLYDPEPGIRELAVNALARAISPLFLSYEMPRRPLSLSYGDHGQKCW